MRVVVADDTLVTREGIVRLLRDAGVEVVAQAGDAGELLRDVAVHRPDVAIVDIRMPPSHTDEGLVAAQQIRAEHLNCTDFGGGSIPWRKMEPWQSTARPTRSSAGIPQS